MASDIIFLLYYFTQKYIKMKFIGLKNLEKKPFYCLQNQSNVKQKKKNIKQEIIS